MKFKETLSLHQKFNRLVDSDRALASELLSQLDAGDTLTERQWFWIVKLETRASRKCRRSSK